MRSRFLVPFMAVGLCAAPGICESLRFSTTTAASTVAADKKVKASVSGTGKSKFAAETDAKRAAREVAGGSYRTIRSSTTGSGSSWTCAMTIEYAEKN